MSEANKPGSQLRRRLRRAAGQLAEDSSLRSFLTDEQAQQLLEWGMAHVRQEANRTANLPDEDAAPLLEERVTAVRSVMQLVNRLMGSLAEAADGDELIDDRAIRLLKNLSWLTGQPSNMGHMRRVEQFKRGRADKDKEKAFQALLDLIQSKPATIEEQEEEE
jgi:hypothetical protein